MKLTPTPIKAALAGAFAGICMPILWSRFGNDSLSLVPAFLLVVVLPAHAFVAGFTRTQAANPGTLDTALLKRIGVWFGAAVIAMAVAEVIRAYR